MELYKFQFGEMRAVQADPSSPKLVVMDVQVTVRDKDAGVLHTATVHVHTAHDENATIAQVQQDAYGIAARVLATAASLMEGNTAETLTAKSQQEVLRANASS